MHEYEAKLLSFLSKKGSASLSEIEGSTGMQKDSALWAIESLAKRNAVEVHRVKSSSISISAEGSRYATEFPEEALAKKIRSSGSIMVSAIKDQIALGWARKNNWIKINGGKVSLTAQGREVVASGKYKQRSVLSALLAGANPDDMLLRERDTLGILSKRNLIEISSASTIDKVSITKIGLSLLSGEPKDQGIGPITRELLKSGSWKGKRFKAYDVNAPTDILYPARLHPVREFINLMRSKWLEMGFTEVSGPIIESAFWNFDALFSPQDHPTREMQDTFFLSNPKQLSIDDVELMQRVKKMHLTGWKEDWSEQLARAAVLRTHTTSVSARHMRMLAESAGSNYPAKIFSIGSVFRNESIDYKHLAELRQYDGIIAGDNLTLANLISTLRTFYSKLGIDDVRAMPSYFPFTEPSIEFFYYDKDRKDYIELCGGGMIRREITKSMGLSKTVLAWGGGVDRLLLNPKIFGVESLQSLYKNDISWLRSRKNLEV